MTLPPEGYECKICLQCCLACVPHSYSQRLVLHCLISLHTVIGCEIFDHIQYKNKNTLQLSIYRLSNNKRRALARNMIVLHVDKMGGNTSVRWRTHT